jgi:hypothetical protein
MILMGSTSPRGRRQATLRSFLALALPLLGLGVAGLHASAPSARADDEPPVPGQPAPGEPPAPEPPPAPAFPPPAPLAGENPPVEEDEVELKTGTVWRGHVTEESEACVVVETLTTDGGVMRLRFKRAEVHAVRRGPAGRARPAVPQAIRDQWFLLRSRGETVGVRRLALRTARVDGGPGFRLEESVVHFAQGRHIPGTRIDRSEEVDMRFLPRRLFFREVGDPSSQAGGPTGYERGIAGRVADGLWQPTLKTGDAPDIPPSRVPEGIRGRLGLREHLLRGERAVGVVDVEFLDPALGGVVTARAGFTAVESSATGRGDEFAWEEGGRRLLVRFRGTEILEEEIAEGVTAVPVAQTQAEAAEKEARKGVADPESRDVTIAEAGIAFTLPGPDWTLAKPVGSAVDAGRRVVARLETPATMSDVRVEWDPEGAVGAASPAEAEASLLLYLRTACPDLAVTEKRRALAGVENAWRLGVEGTLRGDKVRTIAVVLDRGRGRVLVLAACPIASWASGERALETFVASIRGL